MIIRPSLWTVLLLIGALPAGAQGNSTVHHQQTWTEVRDIDSTLAGAEVLPGSPEDYKSIVFQMGNNSQQDETDTEVIKFEQGCPEVTRLYRAFGQTPINILGYHDPSWLWYWTKGGFETSSYSLGHNRDNRALLYFTCKAKESFWLVHGARPTLYEGSSRSFRAFPDYDAELGDYELLIDSRPHPRYVELPPEQMLCTSDDTPVVKADEIDLLEAHYFDPAEGRQPEDLTVQVVEVDFTGVDRPEDLFLNVTSSFPAWAALVSLYGQLLWVDQLDPDDPFVNRIAPSGRSDAYGPAYHFAAGDIPERAYLFLGALPDGQQWYELRGREVCVRDYREMIGFSRKTSIFVEFIHPQAALADLRVEADGDSLRGSFVRTASAQINDYVVRLSAHGDTLRHILDAPDDGVSAWVTETDSTYTFQMSRRGISGEATVTVVPRVRGTYEDRQPAEALAISTTIALPAGTASEIEPPGASLALSVPHPNPARGSVSLDLTLDHTQAVEVVLLDVLGREVLRLHAGPLAAGTHPLTVETAGLPSGTFHVRARSADGAASRALTVLR